MSGCQHHGCDAVLSRRNRSGYCKRHISAVNAARPEFAEKIRQGIKRKALLDPVFADGMRKRAIKLNKDPEIRARKTKRFIEMRIWEVGAIHAATPEARAKAGRARTETCFAWCPRELRQMYRDLTKLGHRAPDAKRIVLEHHEAEMRKFRARLTGEHEPLKLRIPPPDKLGDVVEVVAIAMEVPANDLLSGSRLPDHVAARACAAQIMSRNGMTPQAIAAKLNRDRTSVLHLLGNWPRYVERRPEVVFIVERMCA